MPHCAAIAPSTTLWSLDSVTFIMLVTSYGSSPSIGLAFGTTRFSAAATAKMQAYGGLMIAEKLLTPNMPILEIVNVPPDKSC